MKDLPHRFGSPLEYLDLSLGNLIQNKKSERECHLSVLQQSFKIPILTSILPRSMGGGKINTTVCYCKAGFDNYQGTDKYGSLIILLLCHTRLRTHSNCIHIKAYGKKVQKTVMENGRGDYSGKNGKRDIGCFAMMTEIRILRK